MTTAEILAVGSELLTPHRSDTNSLYLTLKLNEIGIDVRAKAVVRDDRGDLQALVRQALGRADLVITTGGLGPTDDDITREAVAAELGLALDEDASILAALHERFAIRRLTMPAINRRQALVPRGATPLPNSRGTAPGLWIERGHQALVLLPGPPRELEPMVETYVLPRLTGRTAGHRLARRVIKIAGRAESHVDEIAQPIYAAFRSWPTPIETTILAGGGQIELHLSARGGARADLDAVLDDGVRRLASALGPAVFSVDGRSLEEVVGHLLAGERLTIAAAESCTGGLLMSRLVDVPGCSAWVVGGVVAYANAIKISELDVSPDLLEAHGAVSEPVALAMASGVVARLAADVGVAITGIAGPTGGTPDKPVGTTVVAVWRSADLHIARTCQFLGDRATIRLHAAVTALDMVRRMLVDH
jgi:nicotinamide-nucleotide amidase